MSHIRGSVETEGDERVAAVLARAWLCASEQSPDDLTHNFHAYPARLPPRLVRSLLSELATPGEVVLDPFAGSGTTLVEAVASGCVAAGVDINPVALRIAWARTRLWAASDFLQVLEAAESIGEEAFKRARGKVRVELGPAALQTMSWYPPHVLFELQTVFTLLHEAQLDEDFVEMLRMVFSSLLVKVSYQASETDPSRVERRVGRGTVSRLFTDKTRLLVQGLQELGQLSPKTTPAAALFLGDALELADVPSSSVDWIISSPPYPGVYDYVEHQALRFPWLGEQRHMAERAEIGARRDQQDSTFAGWQQIERAFLSQFKRVLRPGQLALVVMGDSALEGRAYRADESMAMSARAVGLEPLAVGSQGRPVTHPDLARVLEGKRREHLMAFRRPAGG